jgi:uncharacterized coiled-coil DUF342 family protein
MKKLSASDHKDRDDIIKRYQEAYDKLERQHQKIADEVAEYNAALSEINEIIDEAHEWANNIYTAIDEYIDNRSEEWQESERGYAFTEWRDQFQLNLDHGSEIELSDFDLPSVEDEISLPASEPEEV